MLNISVMEHVWLLGDSGSNETSFSINRKAECITSMRAMIFSLLAFGTGLAAATDSGTNQIFPTVPESYTLQADGTLLNKTNLFFEPVHYRPIAAKVIGLKRNTISLDGVWRIDPKPAQDVRENPLNATNWGNSQDWRIVILFSFGRLIPNRLPPSLPFHESRHRFVHALVRSSRHAPQARGLQSPSGREPAA
jgi:hypothetical protein